jgi:hypothetical protein
MKMARAKAEWPIPQESANVRDARRKALPDDKAVKMAQTPIHLHKYPKLSDSSPVRSAESIQDTA